MTSRERKISAIAANLLKWFAENARDLPWRRTRDPYCVHVSEVMLQQTQVATVIPFYERWMREVPDIQALANLEDARLLKLWEGLGYYSRARNLKRAALEIIARHGGIFPESREDILALPGVGPYTAGAISSLAFNLPEAAVDGNVVRVLARVFLIRGNPKDTAVLRRLRALASALVSAASGLSAISRRPCGDLTEALMELGALVCTTANPRCSKCPIAGFCLARAKDLTHKYPQPSLRAPTVNRTMLALVLTRGKRVLLRQRPARTHNAGFWELPCIETRPGDTAMQSLSRLLDGAGTSRPRLAGKASHSIMNSRIIVEAHVARFRGGTLPVAGQWMTESEIGAMPLTTISRKVLALCKA